MQLRFARVNGLADTVDPMATWDAANPPVSTSTGFHWTPFWTVASVASGLVSAYHGVKRHDGSVGWGVLWGIFGSFFIGIGPVIAFAQGYAKPMKGK